MCVYFRNALFTIAKAFSRRFTAQLLNQVVGMATDHSRERDHVNPLQDDVVSFHGIRRAEWRAVVKI